MTEARFTVADKLECAEREAKMRRRAYPKWIEGGRMTAQKAAREIALMDAIVEDYRKLAGGERLL